tara:strand:- start:180 stop:389 length:210 start_codon:yes stop_codon:yes gene_type:complete
MTRLVEIITNTLTLKKQVLEVELEEVINSTEGNIEERIDRGLETLKSISDVNNIKQTLESYINNNKNKK